MNTTPFSVSSPREPSDFTSSIPSFHSKKNFKKTSEWSEHHWYIPLYRLSKTLVFTAFAVPSMQWPILIYEVLISFVSKLEQKASVYIRKWLKLHTSITSLLFYSWASPFPLPVRSLTSVLKSFKITRHLLLKHSQDGSVSSCLKVTGR